MVISTTDTGAGEPTDPDCIAADAEGSEAGPAPTVAEDGGAERADSAESADSAGSADRADSALEPALTTADVEVARAARAAREAARANRDAIRAERAKRWQPVRWVAVGGWAALLTTWIWTRGVPFDREGLILWMSGGMFAASIGRRALWSVFVDWLPFVFVLIAYDFARGASQKLNATTQWTPQIDIDKWIFFGHEPTVWLQQHFEEQSVRWWDGGVSLVYTSFFLLPYVLAAILWVRSRGEFYRFAYRFVALSFLGVAGFILFPAAPPWAAARCTATDVAHHPAYPICLYGDPSYVNGGLLGRFTPLHSGVAPYVERLSGRGFGQLHIPVAASLLNKGQGTVDLVAAIPSLHAGVTLLVVLFLWRRMRIWWRIFGVAYCLAMAFSLVYSAEHYFVDVLIGWLLAGLVMIVFGRFDRWRAARRQPAAPGSGWLSRYAGRTTPEPSPMENQWPPIETTPSSA